MEPSVEARLSSATPVNLSSVRALTFDVFGTVVDWRGSVIHEGEQLGRAKGIDVDWAEFADRWRAGYAPAMARVRNGELPWTRIDVLHRMILDGLLDDLGITGLSEDEKDYWNRVWHRLAPWPDSVAGLTRLRQRFIVATLSNGNVALLTNMAKHAGLPWDCILSAELMRRYKPDPETYRGAADLLSLRPEEVIMVAAHKSDLRSAQEVGLRAAFVARPHEFGPSVDVDVTPEADFDVNATDIEELASKLGC